MAILTMLIDAFCAMALLGAEDGEGNGDEQGRDAYFEELPAREMIASTSSWQSMNLVL